MKVSKKSWHYHLLDKRYLKPLPYTPLDYCSALTEVLLSLVLVDWWLPSANRCAERLTIAFSKKIEYVD